MEDVDRILSANQRFIVKEDMGTAGPNGETKVLSNYKMSVWLPKNSSFSTTIHFEPKSKVPFIFDEKTKQSHFCIDLFKQLMDAPQEAPKSEVPLPGTGSSKDSADPAAVPLPGSDKNAKGPAAPEHVGSVPLPGMAKDAKSASPTLPDADQPVCACGFDRKQCADCNQGWLTVLVSGKVPTLKSQVAAKQSKTNPSNLVPLPGGSDNKPAAQPASPVSKRSASLTSSQRKKKPAPTLPSSSSEDVEEDWLGQPSPPVL